MKCLAIVLVIGAVLAGCSAKKMYSGPDLPDSDVATVTGSRTVAGVRIFFRAWNHDGRELTVYKIEVPAGRQRITVHFSTPNGEIYRYGRTLRFEAEGGHTYQVKGIEWDDKVHIWVEDTYTHEVVGGERP